MHVRGRTVACVFVAAWCAAAIAHQSQTSAGQPVVLYEGARLIDGRTGTAIENAAFLVNGARIARVGEKGEIAVSGKVARVDLTGKTVIPALVSAHVHVGLLDGSDFGPQVYTRDKIVEHLQRYAYYGVGAVLSAGTDVGTLSFEIRREQRPGLARLLTSGRGMAAPDAGPGFASIADTSFPITSGDEGRFRVRELAAHGANAIKIWVDDRGGRVEKLTRDLYQPIIEEAHALGMMTLAHVYYLKDAHELVDAGIDGFMHLVRDEVMDDGLIARMKSRNIFAAANIGGARRAALSEIPSASLALLSETIPGTVVEQFRRSLRAKSPEALTRAQSTYDKMARSLSALTAAGVTVVLGGDTGIPSSWHGWAEHYELETMVAAGMTPGQAIVAATSAAANVLKLGDLGAVAAGKSADFVVLDANPLDDITNTRRIAAVYLQGRAIDRATLRSRWRAN